MLGTSGKFYHYEDIAKFWSDNQVKEAKIKRLFPDIDIGKLRFYAMQWSFDKMYPEGNYDWLDYRDQYDSPIQLAEWIIHPDNDSYGCNWFRETMRKPEIRQDVLMDISYNIMKDLDREVWRRFENLHELWGETGGYWITQVAFYAVHLDGNTGYSDLDNGLGFAA